VNACLVILQQHVYLNQVLRKNISLTSRDAEVAYKCDFPVYVNKENNVMYILMLHKISLPGIMVQEQD
jgi:hypothetical protein